MSSPYSILSHGRPVHKMLAQKRTTFPLKHVLLFPCDSAVRLSWGAGKKAQ